MTEITIPEIVETRGRLLQTYRDALRVLFDDAEEEIPSGEWEGVPVVTRKALDEAMAAVFSQPVPHPDETWAEVSTPATVIASTRCPECHLLQRIPININAELLVADGGRELRAKPKTKGSPHICGQLPLPEEADAVADGQESFELEDIVGEICGEPGPADGFDPCTLPVGHSDGHLWGADVAPDGTTATIEAPDPEPELVRDLVNDGESLDGALERIEQLEDHAQVIGSPAGQALLEAVKNHGGEWIPFPISPRRRGKAGQA